MCVRSYGIFSGRMFSSHGYRQQVTEPVSLRTQVSSALTSTFRVGWQARFF